ncbi:hypothetical protein VTL71DRAFT_3830 [Oculimacula yallundae]|uniref:2EXR domain-containing protein n=1 Tax=Oculimacula yallundae TaxID=86028 RepID=A0ABR4C4U0_9HELO
MSSSSQPAAPSSTSVQGAPDAVSANNSNSTAIMAQSIRKSLGINPYNPNNEFKMFRKLPLELRRMCLREVFLPRIVEVVFEERRRSKKEWRAEGLTVYRLSFQHKNARGPVYFCPHLDTISFRGPDYEINKRLTRFLKTGPDPELIQKMSFADGFFSHRTTEDYVRLSPRFPNLTEVSFYTYLNAYRCEQAHSIQEENCHKNDCHICPTPCKGRTVFLDEEDLDAHSGLYYPACAAELRRAKTWCTIKHTNTSADTRMLLGMDKGPVNVKVAFTHRIPKGQFFAKSGRVYVTRGRPGPGEESKEAKNKKAESGQIRGGARESSAGWRKLGRRERAKSG